MWRFCQCRDQRSPEQVWKRAQLPVESDPGGRANKTDWWRLFELLSGLLVEILLVIQTRWLKAQHPPDADVRAPTRCRSAPPTTLGWPGDWQRRAAESLREVPAVPLQRHSLRVPGGHGGCILQRDDLRYAECLDQPGRLSHPHRMANGVVNLRPDGA